MRDYVIPPERKLYLRIIDRVAEVTLVAGIAAQVALAFYAGMGG
jgi:hypothetical protein